MYQSLWGSRNQLFIKHCFKSSSKIPTSVATMKTVVGGRFYILNNDICQSIIKLPDKYEFIFLICNIFRGSVFFEISNI